MRLKHAKGANTASIETRRMKNRPVHQCCPNHPSNTPKWWLPLEDVPESTSPCNIITFEIQAYRANNKWMKQVMQTHIRANYLKAFEVNETITETGT